MAKFSSSPGGGRLPRSERRAQLLAAAHDVFAHNGYHAAAMDDIADRAGVSKPVLYQHFPGKLDLYLALLDGHVNDLIERVSTALQSTTDNKLRVHAAVKAFFDFVGGNPGAFRMIFESDSRAEPAVHHIVERASSTIVDEVSATIAADAGLDGPQARLLAAGLVGLSHISARSWLEHHRDITEAEAIELTVNLVWRGIGGGFPLHRAG